jgi:hypothetical protein
MAQIVTITFIVESGDFDTESARQELVNVWGLAKPSISIFDYPDRSELSKWDRPDMPHEFVTIPEREICKDSCCNQAT